MNKSKKNIYILVFVLFVVMLGYGIIIPILPFYIENMGAGGTELGLLVALYAVTRLIFGPFWGGLSDRVGRKPILLIGIMGYSLTMIWFGLATRLWMLFAARILSGILSSATAPTTMAFIGDSTPEKERSSGMGMLGSAGGIGTIIGPALGGLTAGESLSTPFFIAAGLSLISLFLAILFLPESLRNVTTGERKEKEKLIDLNRWLPAIKRPIIYFLILTFISTSGLMIFANVFGLYVIEKYQFRPDDVGMMLMVLGGTSALAQGLLAGPLTRKCGEGSIIKIGMIASSLGLFLMLLADTYLSIMLTTAFFGLTIALIAPSLSSVISQYATIPQGTVMGLNNSFVSLGRIVGPIIGGLTLDINLDIPYIIGGGFMLLGFLVSMLTMKSTISQW